MSSIWIPKWIFGFIRTGEGGGAKCVEVLCVEGGGAKCVEVLCVEGGGGGGQNVYKCYA